MKTPREKHFSVAGKEGQYPACINASIGHFSTFLNLSTRLYFFLSRQLAEKTPVAIGLALTPRSSRVSTIFRLSSRNNFVLGSFFLHLSPLCHPQIVLPRWRRLASASIVVLRHTVFFFRVNVTLSGKKGSAST